MLTDSFEHLEIDQRLRDNPLVSHLAPFVTSLVENGYAKSTVQSKLYLLASFGHWLERRRLSIADFDEQFVERFIAYKRQKGRVHRGNRETLLQFLDHLRKRDVIPGPTPTYDDSPLAAILTRYEKHLRSERGLAAATVIKYLPCIRKFLIERFREKPLLLREVRSSDVADFILRYAPTMSPRRAQLVTAAFRSFFRFLFQDGELQVNLALSVPSVADRRLATIWSGASPRGTVRWNRGQRSRFPAFFLIGINERRPTSIATKRSRVCFVDRRSFHRRKDCGLPPTPRSSAFSQ
jgi:hypothetical protein